MQQARSKGADEGTEVMLTELHNHPTLETFVLDHLPSEVLSR